MTLACCMVDSAGSFGDRSDAEGAAQPAKASATKAIKWTLVGRRRMSSWSAGPFDLRIVRSEGRRKGSHAERLFDLAIRLNCLWLEGDELAGFEGGDGFSVTQEDAV